MRVGLVFTEVGLEHGPGLAISMAELDILLAWISLSAHFSWNKICGTYRMRL